MPNINTPPKDPRSPDTARSPTLIGLASRLESDLNSVKPAPISRALISGILTASKPASTNVRATSAASVARVGRSSGS